MVLKREIPECLVIAFVLLRKGIRKGGNPLPIALTLSLVSDL